MPEEYKHIAENIENYMDGEDESDYRNSIKDKIYARYIRMRK